MAKNKNRKKVRVIPLGKIKDRRGNLSVVETGKVLPFDIERTYWIYDVPGGKARGGHAYRKSEEFVIALSGSFDIETNNGIEEKTYHLDRCNSGIYIPAGTWRQLKNFATNSVALVIASTPYNPRDYIRNFETFVELKQKGEL